MSLETPTKLQCPKCSHQQAVVVWQSLNVDVTPEAKKELFEGRINVLICDRCGNRAEISTPFMYHDMRRQICVKFYPPEVMQDIHFLKQFEKDGTLDKRVLGGATLHEYMRTMHVVFSMEELLCYVIFRERLYEHHAFKPPGL